MLINISIDSHLFEDCTDNLQNYKAKRQRVILALLHLFRSIFLGPRIIGMFMDSEFIVTITLIINIRVQYFRRLTSGNHSKNCTMMLTIFIINFNSCQYFYNKVVFKICFVSGNN